MTCGGAGCPHVEPACGYGVEQEPCMSCSQPSGGRDKLPAAAAPQKVQSGWSKGRQEAAHTAARAAWMPAPKISASIRFPWAPHRGIVDAAERLAVVCGGISHPLRRMEWS